MTVDPEGYIFEKKLGGSTDYSSVRYGVGMNAVKESLSKRRTAVGPDSVKVQLKH